MSRSRHSTIQCGLIRRRCGEDAEFRLIWDDFLAASKAWRHFRMLGEHGTRRAEEYRELRTELAEEVRSRLGADR